MDRPEFNGFDNEIERVLRDIEANGVEKKSEVKSKVSDSNSDGNSKSNSGAVGAFDK